ncbi:MAG: ABC transporter substrate-binding protein [Streptosporangiaceae bacterium]
MPSRREFVRAGGRLAAVAAVSGLAGCRLSGPPEVVLAWADDDTAGALRDVVRLFENTHAGSGFTVDVRRQPYPGVYGLVAAEMKSRRRGGDLADMLYVRASHLVPLAQRFPDAFRDLSEFGADGYRHAFSSRAWRLADGSGRVLAMPWDIRPAGVFHRVDLFDRAGVDAGSIETWADYVGAAREVKAATGARTAFDIADPVSVVGTLLNEQGAALFDARGRVAVGSAAAVAALRVIKRLRDEELLLLVEGFDAQVAASTEGKVAGFVADAGAARRLQDRAPRQKGRWDVFPVPAFARGGSRAASYGHDGPGGLAVLATSEADPESAWAYIRFALTDPHAQLVCLRRHGRFPSLLRTYADPYFSRPVPYFDDKPIFKVFADEAPHLPSVHVTPDDARAVAALGGAVRRVLLEGAEVERTLRLTAEKLAKATDRQMTG